MKKILYILSAVVVLLSSCAKSDVGSVDPNITTKEGEVTLALSLNIQGAELQAVESRASVGDAKENVASLKGYAFVFGEDKGAEDHYGDNSKLLQKVAFKSALIGDKALVYITLKEQADRCFIRLMTCMTNGVYQEMNGFVSEQMVEDGESTDAVTTFAEYKHISVGLDGYYASAIAPDPTQLTSNLAFPLASPGIDMLSGISQEAIDEVNPLIFMVPVASKVDVTSDCDFILKEVTLLNGAKRARMRSTVLEDDGVTSIHDLPLPINLGGVVQYAALSVTAGSKTTEATPIYFYPNEGDSPTNPLDPAEEDVVNISDPISGTNPTYLIIKGQAAGYDTDGFYKIPIRYKSKKADGSVAADYTYNIVRNNHYKVRLVSVKNAGYASFAEADNGPANDIAYDIEIGGGNASEDDTFTDPRAETIVSHNGFFHIELVGSEIFAQGYYAAGVEGSFGLSLTRNNSIDTDYDIPTLTITGSDGITIKDNATIAADNFAGSIEFTATQSGTITLRCGDMVKKIPVHYSATPHVYGGATTIGGAALGAVSSLASDADESYNKDAAIINIANGQVAANTTYKNREFRGKAYPSDMSKGIRKVYVVQASNFRLYDNVTTKEADASQAFVYQSTGNIYTYNGTDVADVTGNDARSYKINGEVTKSHSGDFGPFPSLGWFSDDFSFEPDDIGMNMVGGAYVEANAHIQNNIAKVTLTNIAAESKEYTIKVEQYAAPYEEGTDETVNLYTGKCYGHKGEHLGWVYIYNAIYIAQPYDETTKLGYRWLDETDITNRDKNSRINAAANDKYISVLRDPLTCTEADTDHKFEVKRNNERSFLANSHWRYAVFEINCRNGANEHIKVRINTRVNND